MLHQETLTSHLSQSFRNLQSKELLFLIHLVSKSNLLKKYQRFNKYIKHYCINSILRISGVKDHYLSVLEKIMLKKREEFNKLVPTFREFLKQRIIILIILTSKRLGYELVHK